MKSPLMNYFSAKAFRQLFIAISIACLSSLSSCAPSIDQIEQEVDELLGDSVPKGEALYEDLSGADCEWLSTRGTFYTDTAQDWTEQADMMTAGSQPQIAMYEQAEVANQRAKSFAEAYEAKCQN